MYSILEVWASSWLVGCLRSYSENDHDLEIFHAELIIHDPFCHRPCWRLIFDNFYLQGPEYEEFIAAAIAEEGTEFLQTTNADIVQLFIKPPFIALRKPQAVNFAAFGAYSIGFCYLSSLTMCVFVPNLTVCKGLSHCEVWWGGVGGHYSESEILSFVELNKHPLVSCLNSTTARRVYSSPIKHHVCLIPELLISFGSLLNLPQCDGCRNHLFFACVCCCMGKESESLEFCTG